MKNWTGRDIAAAREHLESAGALLLGRMLFEHGHLEMELALCLAWADDGKEVEGRTEAVESLSLAEKLALLKQLANSKYKGSREPCLRYRAWVKDAQVARRQRNHLVHGRWGSDPMRQELVNVVGIPTSPAQREVRYTLEGLEASVAELQRIRRELRELRDRWPL